MKDLIKKSVFGKIFLVVFLGLFAVNVSAARKGGEFVWIMPYGNSVKTLDPHATNSEPNLLVILNIHRGLYSWDGAKGTYRLELAKSVKVSSDGLTYTYILRDAKFHNGRTITADDIIYSYSRLANPDEPMDASNRVMKIKGAKEYLDGKANSISGLKKINKKTVAITFTDPVDPGFILWAPNASIVPKEEVAKGNFASAPVGCGPFKFVKWVKGSEIILERNPYYYKKGKPYLDKLVYKIMSDGAARDMAFMAKELDANLLGEDQYAKYRDDPDWQNNMIEIAEQFTRAMAYNPDFTLPDGRKPFGDKRVRQAFNYAINTQLVVEKYAKGKGYPGRGFLCASTPGYDPDGIGYEYNLEKAKQLMKEAGYSDGFTFEVSAQKGGSAGSGVVEAASSFLRKINIKTKINVAENAVHYKNYLEGNYNGAAINSHSSGPDAIDVMARFHSENPRFKKKGKAAFYMPAFDKALDLAAAERNPETRMELIKVANNILAEEAVFWFYNYNKAIIMFHPWVHGMTPVGVEMMYQDMESVWVDKASPRAK
jgi:peptide/nickel transport system substrate-binding protein